MGFPQLIVCPPRPTGAPKTWAPLSPARVEPNPIATHLYHPPVVPRDVSLRPPIASIHVKALTDSVPYSLNLNSFPRNGKTRV
jgi:hypothetical protein